MLRWLLGLSAAGVVSLTLVAWWAVAQLAPVTQSVSGGASQAVFVVASGDALGPEPV